MKLGILSDIHSRACHVQAALDRLREEQVDQVVVLGDVVDLFGRFEGAEETCRLLAKANAVGVWGNHDYGLCVDPDPSVRVRYSPSALDFMASLRPRLELADCYFSHVEPWLNPEDMPDLWYGGGPPDRPETLDRIFNAVPHRVIFAGHYHCWLAAMPNRVSDWDGTTRIVLDQGRYFIVVGALCYGNFATFDTVTAQLCPMGT
jgi:hypothetical protein